MIRSTYGIIPAQEEQVGNMNIRRPFPTRSFRQLSPFLLFDHMGPRDIPAGEKFAVPPHPHAGFQTVTYFLEGIGYHQDSLGNTQSIRPGDVNWMTAGKGIVHAEYSDPEFNRKGGAIQGFQIWVDLPSEHRDVDPQFGSYQAEQLPVVAGDQYQLRVIAGSWQGHQSPVKTYSPVHLYHLWGEAGQPTFEFPAEWNHAVYLAQGAATVNGKELLPGDLLVFRKEEGRTQVQLSAPHSHLLVLAGVDLGSSHVSYGPFVANNPTHLQEQAQRYESGAMGSLKEWT